MQLKDIFSASSDGVSQPSNSSLRFKQKALAATILATLAIIAFIAVEASDTKPARKAPTEAAMITLRPDGTDKDVLIARYDANFLALSRRIEEVQREAAATETRLRAIIADFKANHLTNEDMGGVPMPVGIVSADAEKDAYWLADQLRKEPGCADMPIIFSSVSPVIGAHVGPGMVACVFWGKDRRESLSFTDRLARKVRSK